MKVSYKDKNVWITGASSGIGEALAYAFAREGARLILSSRRTDELERVAARCRELGSEASIVLLDLAVSSQLEKAADEVLATFGHVDVLVNNGGISQRSIVAETPIDVDRRIMEVDYFSGVVLTKKVLPAMLQRGKGHIVAVSSITGKFGFSYRSAYAAAKHAIHGFYESLWAEEHRNGIDVTIICPGRVHTNVSLNAITKTGEAYGIMDHGQDGGISSEQCAREIIKAMNAKKVEAYIGGREILMVYFKRYIPWLFYKLVTKVKPT
ncbi:MAG: SDR family oxidoreductase [Bacteroidota bacterium]|nr:SDR family oxidoreductase [Bacteroidota bacterium]